MNFGWTVLVLIIYVLACARVTRLINADTILDPPRLAIARRARSYREMAAGHAERGWSGAEILQHRADMWATALYFVQCPWCVGWWVCLASALAPVWIIGWPWWTLFPVALAASHLVGVFAFAADTEDVEITDDGGA